jgi:rubrerythrin
LRAAQEDETVQFNADEVFEMAERVEQNGADFYIKAADIHAGAGDVEFLRRLARMEEDHRKTFAEVRAALPDADRQLPDDYPYLKATLFLNTMADAHGGEGLLSQAIPLTREDTLEQLVLRALHFEEDTILFYLGLKDLVPANRGRDRIDRIIEEEKLHVAILAGELGRW